MKLNKLVGTLLVVGMMFEATCASASPGLNELAVRSGFWSNQFPDTAILVEHLYYNSFDKVFDGGGNKVDVAKTKTTANFNRFVRPWHFGTQNEYQLLIEGILPFGNVSWESKGGNPAGHVSGLMDPMVYASFGWNNPAKTTHLQGALAVVTPFGNTDLTNNAWAVQPIIGFEQQFGMFMLDASLSYNFATNKLDGSGDHGKNYFEVNIIPSVNFGHGWDVFLQGDYTNYAESKTGGNNNNDAGYNTSLAMGINNWFRPNMQLGIKFEKDLTGKNTPASQGFNLRYVWIF